MRLALFTNNLKSARDVTKTYVMKPVCSLHFATNTLASSTQLIELAVNLDAAMYQSHQSQLNSELAAEATSPQ